MENLCISDEELEILAKKHKVSIEEMKKDIELDIKELNETNKGIEHDIERNNYIRFPNNLNIFGYGKDNELNNKYLCYTSNIGNILKKGKDNIAIVSGFGATNPPTAGTLSMLLKLIELQSKTGIYTYLIINDLGTINARNININKALDLTEQYKRFVVKMGFDIKNGEIRTHNNLDHARTFSLISRVIKLSDFAQNGEVTDDTYERLKLKGNDFSVMIDHTYTAADVLLPILKDHKSGIIVSCGLEEYYHANIGRIALENLMKDESIRELIPNEVEIGAIYGKLVNGFFPYFKQSKSIPNASVHLGNTKNEIYDKIINSFERDQNIILQMIKLASNFSDSEILKAEKAFENRNNDSLRWMEYKKKYYEYFNEIKKIWDSCKVENKSIKEKLYC